MGKPIGKPNGPKLQGNLINKPRVKPMGNPIGKQPH
jgi:hypothetical protein